MTTTTTTRCEHYWRDGILLVERGRPDPHRDSCLDCRREHEGRAALVRALQLTALGSGDPRWQAKVWARIDRERAARPSARQVWLPWASAFAAACALIVFVQVSGLLHRERETELVAESALVSIQPAAQMRGVHRGTDPTRSLSALIGDRARIWFAPHQEVRIYRGGALLARCAAAAPEPPRCTYVGVGVIAEQVLELPGQYRLLVAPAGILAAPAAAAAGALDRDVAELNERAVGHEVRVITVR